MAIEMPKNSIIVVEDERDMAELVAMRLKREGYEVRVVHDGLSALDFIRCDPPDLVLLDIMLPKMSGTEVLKEMRGDPRASSVPVIMLTARGEESDIVVGLEFGADDYVTKPFSMSVLMARVAAVLRRSTQEEAAPRSILHAGPIRVDRDRHLAQVDGEAVSLTLTEFKILVALMAAKGRVLTRDQLIDQALGMDAVVTDRTIDVHLTALRRKLGDARRYIQTVRGIGYRLATEEYETA